MNEGLPVVIDPPPGNDPDAPGRRHLQSNCRHLWDILKDPFDKPTGKLRCLRCGDVIEARKEDPGPWTPRPSDPMTGY